MEDFLKKVKNILSGLSEIQPNVSMSGLHKEALVIRSMKNEVTKMIRDLTPDPQDTNLVVDALRKDLFSSLRALQKQLVWRYERPIDFGRADADTPPPRNHGTDDQLMLASAAAENFSKRYHCFINVRDQHEILVQINDDIATLTPRPVDKISGVHETATPGGDAHAS